ncbi:GldG family protein [Ketobacter sp.]|uniref:GldG family protein n=1 Tax=Ketobacter sp. TaxID=2083498 RepID=UPI000F21497A|nr:Gldg family protein [Ketobacter sp.]RLT92630.1 MAG: ABC transporter [Ketobacter sp.]
MRVSKWFSGAGLVVLALAMLFSTLFTDWVFKSARVDLTEGGLYTLSTGSKNIVRDLQQPLDLYFFFSTTTTKDALAWRNYAKQVRELLEEFELASQGRIKLTVIDPEPFSEDEDRAAAFGLQAAPIGNAGDTVYFGLVAQYGELEEGASAEESERPTLQIPFFKPDRQEFLEYDIAKMIYQVSQEHKPRVGLIAGLEVEGGFNMMMRQPTQPWFSVDQIRQLFDVSTIGNDQEDISTEDYDLLVVIHPKDLPDTTLFAIDQFVLRGGHAIFFVDPYAELAQAPGSKASDDLNKLFNAWGVDVSTREFVGDAQLALQVGSPSGQPVRHLGILQLTDQNLARDNQIVSQLETLHMASAGYIKPLEQRTTEVGVLMKSSAYAMPIVASKLDMMQDPSGLAIGFKPTGEEYVLAATVRGPVQSAFPDGVPVSEGEDAPENESETDSEGAAQPNAAAATDQPAEFLQQSQQPINVMIVADTDILTDRLWVQIRQFFGQSVAAPFADNGDFFFNAVDTLSGSPDLVSIRGQGRYFRPFTVVKEMQREAEERFRSVEQDLQNQLQAVEQKLMELQNQQGDDANSITLTPEVEAQLLEFQREKLSIRKKLRNVQHQLNQDIEQLDFTLKLINIALVPLLLTLLLIGVAWLRRRRG